jgi:hypothetical protein
VKAIQWAKSDLAISSYLYCADILKKKANQEMTTTLETIFTILSYIYSILLGQIISGLLVKSGNNWGKVISRDRFAKPHVIFYFVLLDTIICSVLIYFCSAILLGFITVYPYIVYGLTMEIAFFAYVKTCHTLGRKITSNFRKYWKGVLFVQLTSIVNFGIVYALLYYGIL